MEYSDKVKALNLHEELGFIGLRAQATAVGLLQLCSELVKAGVLDDAAIGRIKDAIQTDITVSRPRCHGRTEFDQTLRNRLDAIFPRAGDAERMAPVGTELDMQTALGSTQQH